ncbi:MAG: preprotein translocase subunit SecG [Anaerolineae bacterium]
MATYLHIVQIIISVALIGAILLQAREGGGLGGIFGGDSTVYKSRRGVEKTLFQLTIGLVVIFLLFSVLSVIIAS